MLDQPVMPVVYFVMVSCEILGDPMVKIGITIDPQRRFNELEQEINKENKYPSWLSQGIVEEMTVLGYVQGTQFLETTFHRAFKSKSLGREWFKYDDEMESIHEHSETFSSCSTTESNTDDSITRMSGIDGGNTRINEHRSRKPQRTNAIVINDKSSTTSGSIGSKSRNHHGKGFRIQGRQFAITYPKCEITRDEFDTTFRSKFHSELCVCLHLCLLAIPRRSSNNILV